MRANDEDRHSREDPLPDPRVVMQSHQWRAESRHLRAAPREEEPLPRRGVAGTEQIREERVCQLGVDMSRHSPGADYITH